MILDRLHAKWLVIALVLFPPSLHAQAEGPVPPEAARGAAHALALRDIGVSGLRSLLSASSNLGDLQNRGGSYRMAVQLERARRGPLEGLVAGLEAVLIRPDLPYDERRELEHLRDEALAQLSAVPRYTAGYGAVTGQAEALVPIGFLGERPLFMLMRGRLHGRWGGDDGLTVLSEGATLGPVLLASPRWIVAPGLSFGRTDIDIGPFDGHGGATSLGVRLDVGRILSERWSAAAHGGHGWAWGSTSIVRPGPQGEAEVSTDARSATTSAKLEVRGRFKTGGPGDDGISLLPRVGLFLLSSHTPPTTNSLGEAAVGPFGERETQAALRLGTTGSAAFGRWSPGVYVGLERELADEMLVLVDDPTAFQFQVGVSRSWGRGRRFVADWTLVRGFEGLRRVSELTLVLILDG